MSVGSKNCQMSKNKSETSEIVNLKMPQRLHVIAWCHVHYTYIMYVLYKRGDWTSFMKVKLCRFISA